MTAVIEATMQAVYLGTAIAFACAKKNKLTSSSSDTTF